MKLNEITNQEEFSYVGMDSRIATMLQAKAYRINQITNKSAFEIGKELFEAQQELAKHGYGFFEEWYRSLGFKTTESYQYINHYKFISSESEESKIKLFESLPKSIQVEMSKPSAIPEVNEAVISGDIKTHKEYKELEKQLKQQSEQHQRQLAEKDEVINKTYEKLRKEQQREPQVIEKEVIPEDYEKIKQENEQLKQSNQKLQRDLKWVRDDLSLTQTQYNLLESSTAEAKELERKIQSLQSQEKTIVEKMEAVETFYELERNFNDFFDTKMAPMRFKGIANHLYATNAVDRIRSMITQAELWAEEMNKILPNKNMKILEGEIIND